jgi:heme o synthase
MNFPAKLVKILFLSAREFFRLAGILSKIRISLPVTATTFTGYVVYSGSLSPFLFPLLTGIFLLASGSSALNHYQERKTDALMERTRNRPLPGRLISPPAALIFALTLLGAGSLILLVSFDLPVLLLGLFNVFWYNGVYTNLKKVTAFAVIPGSITGGVPPAIGWVAAGGNLADTGIMIIVVFFIIGQIPHFWLLLLKYGRQYEQAGLPSLTSIFTSRQIKRISLAWIIATVAASMLLPAWGLISNTVVVFATLISAVLLLTINIGIFLMPYTNKSHRIQFNALNIFYLLIMIFLATDNLM